MGELENYKTSLNRVNTVGINNNFGEVLFAILILVVICMIYVVSIVMNGKLIRAEMENKHKEDESAQLTEYTALVEDMYKNLSGFKHDYINILYTLGDFAETGDIKGFQDYYTKELLPESGAVLYKYVNIDKISNIKLTPLKALVSAKIVKANSLGIEMKITVESEIEKLKISTIDICRIMGIFIDNAIEASVNSENKCVKIIMGKEDAQTRFIVSNTCPENMPNVHKIFEKGFTTKGENRGQGLLTVRQIVDKKYENLLLNTTIEDGVFTHELSILD